MEENYLYEDEEVPVQSQLEIRRNYLLEEIKDLQKIIDDKTNASPIIFAAQEEFLELKDELEYIEQIFNGNLATLKDPNEEFFEKEREKLNRLIGLSRKLNEPTMVQKGLDQLELLEYLIKEYKKRKEE